jgi:ABC-type dipeptide/oligopeptide/nickel transport system ATPase subunit
LDQRIEQVTYVSANFRARIVQPLNISYDQDLTINALYQAIQKYEGTVFLVTHDQDLIEEAGTRVWHFEGGPTDFHITDHKGPYEEYQQQLAIAAK